MRLQTNRFRSSGLTLMELVVVVAILAFLAGMVSFNLAPNQLTFGGAGGNKTAGRIATEATMLEVRDAILGRGSNAGYWQDMNRDVWFWPMKLEWLARPPVDAFLLPFDADYATTAYYNGMMSYNTTTRVGWRGPYLRFTGVVVPLDPVRGFTSAYGGNGALRGPSDAWGNPVVMQIPVNLDDTPMQVDDARTDSILAQFLVSNSRLVSAGPDGILTTELNRLALRTYDDFQFNPSLAGDDVVLWLNRW
jgi:prepilin-type N-terminal cleavage/methylation domain-containing protein